jgi:hypothetical protein
MHGQTGVALYRATHMEIDSSRWIHWIADKFRNSVPHALCLPEGGDAWVVDEAGSGRYW